MLNIACFEEPTQCLQLTAPTPKGTASVRDFSVCTGLLAITSLCELCMTLKPFSPKSESSCQRGNAGMGANPNLPLQRKVCDWYTLFLCLYNQVVQLIQCSLGEGSCAGPDPGKLLWGGLAPPTSTGAGGTGSMKRGQGSSSGQRS